MDLCRLSHVSVIKYKSRSKKFLYPDHCSQFLWSPSTCLYPNDCFYFNPNQVMSPLPALRYKTRFSYHRFKHGRHCFRGPNSDDSLFSASTIIVTPLLEREQERIYTSTQLCELSAIPLPLRSIDHLNHEFEWLTLGDESAQKLNLQDELFQFKAGISEDAILRDAESPISRTTSKSSIVAKDHQGFFRSPSCFLSDDLSKSSQSKFVSDLFLESPISRPSQVDPPSRSRDPVLSKRSDVRRRSDAVTQTTDLLEDSNLCRRTIGTQTSS